MSVSVLLRFNTYTSYLLHASSSSVVEMTVSALASTVAVESVVLDDDEGDDDDDLFVSWISPPTLVLVFDFLTPASSWWSRFR